MVTFEQARQEIISQLARIKRPVANVELDLHNAQGCILAQDVEADRDYPPFDRATRDGYAVRAVEARAGAALECAGEIKAGDAVVQRLSPNTCVQIMTGAAVPPGADAVVMIEHTSRNGNVIHFERAASAAQNIVPRGSEAAAGATVLHAGSRLRYAELGLAAQVGAAKLRCAKKPRVAILSTGDEVVAIQASPGPFQIRNGNIVSLAAQVRAAGGEPVVLGNAPDRVENLSEYIQRGLQEDVLVLSGGVSMGKYDLVEDVLKTLGAKFYFDSVAIRPGKPAVFAMVDGKPVFGLPGNPISTMVTFELFVVPAIELLSCAPPRALPLLYATLGSPVKEKPGLTHFLPAVVQWPAGLPTVTPLDWKGSGDTVTMTQANCYLVIPSDIESVSAGENVTVLMRGDIS